MERTQRWWAAVIKRDASCDGLFVYGVRSTGVYCRPACPSRRPNRIQVVFFPGAGAAEQAGFRPCRRCKPRQEINDQSALVRAACRYLESNFAEPVKLAGLSAGLNVSASHLQRVFKRALGISPRQYADACRMKSVKNRLRDGSDVTTALYDAGYGSSSRLYERTSTDFGMTPAVYGKGGRGMRIGYTIVNSAMGQLLVAATARGFCAVSLGDSKAQLKEALLAEYPEAEIRRDNAGLKDAVGRLLRYVNGSNAASDLPLDIRATAFQRRVWDELRAIPYGHTRSYGDIAKAIGNPKAVRAIARACATNPLALIIPCHRVVPKSGDGGGYRWGRERKRALLAREKKRLA